MFDTVLVANRGEIAVRVIRTLRRLGLRSVAVYSDADARARHVAEADAAVRLGPAQAALSYLSAERLLDAAARAGAGAVHPGYGFLAENAGFARAVAGAGLTFIGPPADAIEAMGDKIRAKETVAAAGVPVVPGAHADGDGELAEAARVLGLPVLLKPSAGGGGKGMRLVRDADLLADEIEAARRGALAAFGDGTLLAERWVERPRHIEIQILADGHGTVLHLGERECSLQRRHQKIVEEAPSPFLDDATRAVMGEAAVRAARACGYVGAGTVEFIVPGDDSATHYFMEMNTRLQVEHPVTELVTGLDLVEWQVRVARGERLPFGQDAVATVGHAVEARVCAETARPTAEGSGVDFLPSAGTVLLLAEPEGDGVRTDSGLAEGTEVSPDYDPLLAKVVAHGPDRATALLRLRAALARTTVLGVDTNTGFLRRLLAHPAVVSGELDTGLVDGAASGLLPAGVPEEVYAAVALARQAAFAPAPAPGEWTDPFSVPSGWRLGGEPAWTIHRLRVPGHDPVTVRVRPGEARVGDEGAPVPARLLDGPGGGALRVEYAGTAHGFAHAPHPRAPGAHWLGRDGDAWHVQAYDPVAAAGGAAAPGADTLSAPMPGTVTVVKAAAGEAVTAGQSLLVVEAMKMEHVIAAPHDGTVTELGVSVGATVAMDQVLAVVTPATVATTPVAEPPAPAPQEPS
ncbi:biotin carboxylase N-terminal domain-containing protein [Streptomyces radicis]|uniref:Biotin-dependent 3-methylcrotonyl-coenzyme A carboxylase alpha1 subunit n=1 Tax=Streptomyces radicis TaxID=1750517 RepID=A0A3A9W723_9ACTN|nr:biotin carboxylase N-terminal domain-containing protein [Streptomyces radicis]RKN08985.1 ATP-grasp domain-containing protein [Streptomyces radicis]RKN22824.1 ATP-grasp domain-containing protein [Streptomyces radicis]